MMISVLPKTLCLTLLSGVMAAVAQASPPLDLNLTRWAENEPFKAQSLTFLPGSGGTQRLGASVKSGLLMLDA